MTTEHEVRALLAERYAAIVDLAARDGDGRALLVAGDKLLELLDTLPIRKPDPVGGGGSGDGGTSRGQLLSIMDGGPQVGDSANA